MEHAPGIVWQTRDEGVEYIAGIRANFFLSRFASGWRRYRVARAGGLLLTITMAAGLRRL
jgi:hypothetical protein